MDSAEAPQVDPTDYHPDDWKAAQRAVYGQYKLPEDCMDGPLTERIVFLLRQTRAEERRRCAAIARAYPGVRPYPPWKDHAARVIAEAIERGEP